MQPQKLFTEEQIKDKRVEIDALLNFVREEQARGVEGLINKDEELYGIASYQTVVALKSTKMWLGVMLEGRGTPFPANLADNSFNMGAIVDSRDPRLVYYGPHSCQKCDPHGTNSTAITKAGNGAPDSFQFDYPMTIGAAMEKGAPFAYPNNEQGADSVWTEHVCK